jgi:hypothetical protein
MAVLTYVPDFVLNHGITRQFIQNDYGDGYFQLMTMEAAYSRADGMGAVASHKGLNWFTINYHSALSGSGNLAYNVWAFFLARLDANNESFYFYNPKEKDPPDATGVDTTGRYLVRLANPNDVLSWELFKYCLYSMTGFDLVEERA